MKVSSFMPESFELKFPLTGGGEFQHTLISGDMLFLLGANGTGKSSLVTRFNSTFQVDAKRISAHRQTWFQSNSLEMTAMTRNSMELHVRSQDAQLHSRHIQHYPTERTSMAIFDLIDADNMLARKIADFFRAKDLIQADKAASEPAPIAIINQLMNLSNLPIEIDVEERQKVVAHKNRGAAYSIAELSDGERNAFLMAADVLTAKPGSLLLIDEPERHLHRSIISPLLTLLFRQRADCSFVISTHEMMLPIDNPTATTLLIRSCEYQGSSVQSWTVDLLPSNAHIEEGLKLDILGARQKMIFVEGTLRSLDAPLYSLLFPQVSIIPKSNCREIQNAVRGLRESEEMHWIKAWGIVDNDGRSPDDIERLRAFGVFALPHFSVEALYYHPQIVKKICVRSAALTGKNPDELFAASMACAIAETAKQRDHFVADSIMRLTHRLVFEKMPTKADVRAAVPLNIEIDLAVMKVTEEANFDRFVSEGNLEGILERYPLRESGALSNIATTIGLRNRTEYEGAVRTMLLEDHEAITFLRGLFGDLPSEVGLPGFIAADAEQAAVATE
jgi:ABC-type cobalamin/Fe3+-siderophores transport system ATPase subunit